MPSVWAWSWWPAPASPRARSSPRSSYEAGLDWLTLMWWRFLIGASLAWLWVLASPDAARGRCARCRDGRSSSRSGWGPSTPATRHVLRGHRDRAGGAGRGARLHLPGLRRPAVAALRDAPARAPTVDRAGAGDRRRRAGARRDGPRRRGERAGRGAAAHPRLGRDLLGLDRALRAPVRRATRPARPGCAVGRRRPASDAAVDHGPDDGRDGDRVRGDGRGPRAVARSAEPCRATPGRTSSASGWSPRSWRSSRCTPGRGGSAPPRPPSSRRPSRCSSSSWRSSSWTRRWRRSSSLGAACILIGVVIAQTSPRPRGAPEPATPLEAEVEG